MFTSKYFRPSILAFGVALIMALGLALYSNHTWEDYYITYRSSKNLATGHGLVFNPGERLHTFTSPLGVLLPALAYALTGGTSDVAALWIFRIMSASALGGAALLLLRLAKREYGMWLPAGLPVAWLLTDCKSLDFTINGMETGFMLLFLVYTLWAHLAHERRAWLHLGVAWAGLMWTRPDSFIYITLLAVSHGLMVIRASPTRETSRAMLILYGRAFLVTTALYLPWLLWATAYYGSPLPHTIVAKGGIGETPTFFGLLTTAVTLPYRAWTTGSSLELTFLPSYVLLGGWPSGLVVASKVVATLCSLLWLLPGLKPWSRVASFAFYGAHVYLTYFPYFPFPWYLPSTTLLALIAFSGLVHRLITEPRGRKFWRPLALGLAGLGLITQGWMSFQVARQTRAQQLWVEDSNRRKIGEWLRTAAKPTDTVFMEPLGYIGFFSGLKTYDWPGMSSLEMVRARQKVGANWGALLQVLKPVWLVLRPFEVERVQRVAPGLLQHQYREVQRFDQSAVLENLPVYGLPYLRHDAHFVLFRRQPDADAHLGITLLRSHQAALRPQKLQTVDQPYTITYNDHLVTVVGAPAGIDFAIPPDLIELAGGLGLLNDEWYRVVQDRAVEFQIALIEPNGTRHDLFTRTLHPVANAADRGFLPFKVTLPSLRTGVLRFTTRLSQSDPMATARPVLAFWSELSTSSLLTDLHTTTGLQAIAPDSQARFGLANTEEDGRPCLFAHAPSSLIYAWHPGLNHVEAEYGILRGAYTGEHQTDGVIFSVETVDEAGRSQILFSRHLDPVNRAADRQPQTLSVRIPPSPGGKIVLRTQAAPSGRLDYAWGYWRNLTGKE